MIKVMRHCRIQFTYLLNKIIQVKIRSYVADQHFFVYHSRSFLVRHMKIHNRDAASLECNICNLTFSSFPQRVGHMIKHLPKKYQCPFCSKSCTLRYIVAFFNFMSIFITGQILSFQRKSRQAYENS